MSRLETLIDALQSFYGVLPPPPRDPFALFVWEVLSFHSTPRKRDAAFVTLKRIRALTPDAMWRAPQAKLEASVGLAGPYREQRLRALRTGVDLFRRSPNLPAVITQTMAALQTDLSPGDALSLAKLVTQIDSANIQTLGIGPPLVTGYTGEDGAALLLPNNAAIKRAIQQLMEEPPPTAALAS